MYYRLLIIFLTIFFIFCTEQTNSETFNEQSQSAKEIRPGAWQTMDYFPQLDGKRIGLVVNHTSTVGNVHLVDTVINKGMTIAAIFTPEHGFRGDADAGAKISDAVDAKTGIPLISLYGQKRKPQPSDLAKIDVMVFDIQDVGARFYTYISTLHYVMEACAESGLPLIILDRPNPNGHYIDGPVREEGFQSFVGMHTVPIVYGMTIGEYGQMINGEGWLNNGVRCQLKVVPCKDYDHKMIYDLPHAPSPNLPNLRSILLYPSLCFFEGTPLSIGRGTPTQFQVIGHPALPTTGFTFTPKPMFGSADPPQKGNLCHGEDLTKLTPEEIFHQARLNLDYVIRFYQMYPEKDQFFNENLWFDKLAGTAKLRQQIMAGQSEDVIRASWKEDLEKFQVIRSKYLLYP